MVYMRGHQELWWWLKVFFIFGPIVQNMEEKLFDRYERFFNLFLQNLILVKKMTNEEFEAPILRRRKLVTLPLDNAKKLLTNFSFKY